MINATGTFTDQLEDLAEPKHQHHSVEPAQGTHLVFAKELFDCKHALVIPKTVDGRILFAVPWHDKVLVGTTDIQVPEPSIDPVAQTVEIDLILTTLNQYTKRQITRADVKSVFAGQRPLVKPAHAQNTKKISRKHEILCTDNGLISIVGGKWTIYRRMGEDTLNFAIAQGLLAPSTSVSKNLLLFGATTEPLPYPLSVYGTEAKGVEEIVRELKNDQRLHPDLPYLQAEVIYHLRYEQAKTIEDVLARRTRALFLDARAAVAAAPIVAELMAKYLKQDQGWIAQQLQEFKQLAAEYILT